MYRIIIFFFYFSVCVILISSCGNIVNPPAPLGLITPTNHAEVNPSNILFKWTSESQSPYRFLLSDSVSFNNPIIDDTLNADSILFQGFLQPNKEYFWKIEQDDDSETSAFHVRDILSRLKDEYVANVYHYDYSILPPGPPITGQTYYTDTISLSRIGDDVNFVFQELAPDDINCLLKYYTYRSDLNYSSYLYLGSHFECWMTVNYVTDSIKIACWKGYGAVNQVSNHWIYTFKK